MKNYIATAFLCSLALACGSHTSKSTDAPKGAIKSPDEDQSSKIEDWWNLERGYISEDLCKKAFPFGHFVARPLIREDSKNFQLFYFTTKPIEPSLPYLIYMTGGPGGITGPEGMEAVNNLKMNVIYFHIRGAGCSQIPASNIYDKNIRTRYVVEDIEEIRKDLGLDHWNYIYGHSYGTMLAHKYLEQYPNVTEKLIQEGTMEALSVTEKNHEVASEFNNLVQIAKRHHWISENDISKFYESFINDQKLVGRWGVEYILTYELYNSSTAVDKSPILKKSPSYFLALLLLVYSGWSPTNESVIRLQDAAAARLVSEYLPSRIESTQLEMYEQFLSSRLNFYFRKRSTDAGDIVGYVSGRRVRDVINTFDGLYPWVQKQRDAGEMHPSMEDWVGESNDYASIYDPRTIPLSVPTLMIHGDADVATPIDDAEDYFKNALTGEKMMIVVKGAGHRAFLPNGCLTSILTKWGAHSEIEKLFNLGNICYVQDGYSVR